MFGSKRRLSEALLLLKRVRRIGIRLSIGRRYVCVKTSLFRGYFYFSNGVRRIGIRLSIRRRYV